MPDFVHDSSVKDLQRQHTDEAIAARIAAPARHSYVGDFVLGAVDGAITTFAIVSGVAGAELQGGVAIAFVLGLSNVLADGFSMAVSNFLKARADRQVVERFRAMEEMHIEQIPDREREEIRQIFAAKGFDGPTLDEIVRVITLDRRRWVNTMLTEEWGLQIDGPAPWKAGLVTFLAFLLAGLVPLLPLLLAFGESFSSQQIFAISAALTGVTFFITGLFRGRVVGQSMLVGGVETLLVGGAAAALAFFVGSLLKGLIS
jgi:VIT1/CCC1 family predicted Fe2+/Mn2+ transporter